MGILSNNNTNDDQDQVANFYFPTSKQALIIFTRNPELGKCKTRLAKHIGDQAALDIYKHLLAHTANIAKQVSVDRYVYYSDHIQNNDVWDDTFFRKKTQQGQDLGLRMEQAFLDLFEMGYENVLIIGSDLPDLSSAIITEAYHQLNHADGVIGPAKDGGYYLLGLKTMHQNIFKNKSWGTETVLNDTLANLQNHKIYLLEELNDIDTFDDLKHVESLKHYYTSHD